MSGVKVLLTTNDNEVYLASVENKQADKGLKSEKKLNHDQKSLKSRKKFTQVHHKKASSNNYEAEGANGDYTDSYEAEDEGNTKGQDYYFMINKEYINKKRKKGKKGGNDYMSGNGGDLVDKEQGEEFFKLKY